MKRTSGMKALWESFMKTWDSGPPVEGSHPQKTKRTEKDRALREGQREHGSYVHGMHGDVLESGA